VFERYALFQSLRRREGETEAIHRARQVDWLRVRRQQTREFGDEARVDESTNLGGAWIPPPDEIEGSRLELLLEMSPTARVLVVDIAADRDWLLGRIADLIDRQRAAQGIPSLPRRGRDKSGTEMLAEFREFLRSAREHHIMPLWDLQLAGLATDQGATARTLYPDLADPNSPKRAEREAGGYPSVSARSIPRALLQKLKRARELQDQAVALAPRLCATVG
jgi:hypothetical protein